MKRVSIRIYGSVQGVFFRHSAREKAKELGLVGFARNEEDDSVYIEAEGKAEALEKFVVWCRLGPELAKVEKVDFSFSDTVKGFIEFSIL